MSNRAFTLIEILVVVAIVGILSAVVVGSYKDYRMRANVMSFYPVVDSLAEKAKYIMQHEGRNVTYADLGLSNYTGPHGLGGADPPAGTSEYVESITVFPFYSCTIPGATTMFVVWYDQYALGITNTPNTFGRLVYFIYSVNGVYYTKCNNFDLLPGGIIPGCESPFLNLATGQPGCS